MGAGGRGGRRDRDTETGLGLLGNVRLPVSVCVCVCVCLFVCVCVELLEGQGDSVFDRDTERGRHAETGVSASGGNVRVVVVWGTRISPPPPRARAGGREGGREGSREGGIEGGRAKGWLRGMRGAVRGWGEGGRGVWGGRRDRDTETGVGLWGCVRRPVFDRDTERGRHAETGVSASGRECASGGGVGDSEISPAPPGFVTPSHTHPLRCLPLSFSLPPRPSTTPPDFYPRGAAWRSSATAKRLRM